MGPCRLNSHLAPSAPPSADQPGVVWYADVQAVEHRVRQFLAERTPTISFLGEEEGASPHEADDLLWTLDPIDGTVNYSAGIPCAPSPWPSSTTTNRSSASSTFRSSSPDTGPPRAEEPSLTTAPSRSPASRRWQRQSLPWATSLSAPPRTSRTASRSLSPTSSPTEPCARPHARLGSHRPGLAR